MKLGKTFYTADRKIWRQLLAKHHARAKESWLVYYNKQYGKRSLTPKNSVGSRFVLPAPRYMPLPQQPLANK